MNRFINHVPAHTSWPTTILQFGLLGILVHQYMRVVEVDAHALKYLLAYIFVPPAIVLDLHLHGGLDIPASLLRTLVIGSSFNAGLFGSIFVYRVFFHRLRHFPGPFWAKVSKFWAFAAAIERKKFYLDVAEVHEKYGDFVRVGPRELSILRPSAVNAIYGPSSKCLRGPHYNNPSRDSRQNSIVGARDAQVHRRRRRAWDRGLTGKRALDNYEPRVRAKTDSLLSRIAALEDEPTDIMRLFIFYGFDVMADIGFSQDFGLLKTNKEHPAVEGVREQSLYIGILQKLPWAFPAVAEIIEDIGKMGFKTSFQSFLDWCSQELEARRKAIEFEKENGDFQDPQDVVSWLIKAGDEGDGSAPSSERAFQEDARVIVVAGSDTTSATLGNAFYFLAKYPQTYRKLQQDLATAFPGGDADWTYAKVKDLTFIDHIILETLRLRPAVLGGLPRLTPPEGLQIDGVFIPGDVAVSVPTYTIQRDARYWGADGATEFRPQRWEGIPSQEAVPFLPFTRGRYACVGKNLAMMEMRMVISRLALRYDIEVAKEDEQVVEEWEGKALDSFIMSTPPLPLVFKRRG